MITTTDRLPDLVVAVLNRGEESLRLDGDFKFFDPVLAAQRPELIDAHARCAANMLAADVALHRLDGWAVESLALAISAEDGEDYRLVRDLPLEWLQVKPVPNAAGEQLPPEWQLVHDAYAGVSDGSWDFFRDWRKGTAPLAECLPGIVRSLLQRVRDLGHEKFQFDVELRKLTSPEQLQN